SAGPVGTVTMSSPPAAPSHTHTQGRGVGVAPPVVFTCAGVSCGARTRQGDQAASTHWLRMTTWDTHGVGGGFEGVGTVSVRTREGHILSAIKAAVTVTFPTASRAPGQSTCAVSGPGWCQGSSAPGDSQLCRVKTQGGACSLTQVYRAPDDR